MNETEIKHPAETIEMFEQFSQDLTALKGEVHRTSVQGLGEVVNSIIAGAGATRIAAFRSALLKPFCEAQQLVLPGDAYVIETEKSPAFDEQQHRRRLADSEIAVSSADYLVAQSGTLIFLNANHPSRLITLLSPTLIIIARMSTLVTDLPALHAQLANTPDIVDPVLAYYTGPSRTADIEKTLVLGVHGPKFLHVVVLDDR